MIPARFAIEILPLLAGGLSDLIGRAVRTLASPLEEIRIREERPLQLVCTGQDRFVTPEGALTPEGDMGYRPSRDDLLRTYQLLTQGSVYAWEEEVRCGYLTLRGGHRVGLAGRAIIHDGRIQTFKYVNSLNVRIAREVIGCSSVLLPLISTRGRLHSTLLISPPQAGKTTLLRDLVRQVSTGVPSLGLAGCKVGLVDERSEIAGCHEGVPQRDVGPRTDVLDACPKAEGMMLLIRALSPQVVAVDEIGRPADAEALLEALHAGVIVLATAHGDGLEAVARRPALTALMRAGAFERVAILGRSRGPGTVEQVLQVQRGPEQEPLSPLPALPTRGGVSLAG